MKSVEIEVNKKKYKLQHPGNREWIKLKKDFFSVSGKGEAIIDMEKILDYCFEHVVHPETGPKLSLDDDSSVFPTTELEEVWSNLLIRFLRGDTIDKKKYKT